VHSTLNIAESSTGRNSPAMSGVEMPAFDADLAALFPLTSGIPNTGGTGESVLD
jgi:hypothetical protein